MKIFRTMAGAQPKTSCTSLFKQLSDSTHSTPVYNFIYWFHYQ